MTGARWLAAAAAALLALVVALGVLVRQPGEVAAAPAAAPLVSGAALAAAPPPVVLPAPAPAPVAPAAPGAPARLDPASDAFFYRFQEVVPAQLSRRAATCYEGREGTLHRNQKLVLQFRTRIVDGVVTVADVRVSESSLGDSALEACFLQEVQRATWTDAELPDWDAEDTLVIRPERGLKKYLRSNAEYVGAPAPSP